MKKGKSITELAQELERRASIQQDYVMSTEQMFVLPEGDKVDMPAEEGNRILTLNDNAHAQIADRLKIPKKYYDRMRDESPDLLANNVNHWFHEQPERRMVRTEGNVARAFLSDRYRRVDNMEVATTALTALHDIKGAVPMSMDVTDKKLYLKFLFDDIAMEIKPGDWVKAGVSIMNSEIGHGRYKILGFFWRDYCDNGCIWGMGDMLSIERSHIGGKVIEGTDYQVFKDDTQMAQDAALMKESRDVIAAWSNPEVFARMVEQLKATTEGEKIASPTKGVEVLAKSFGLNETEKEQTLVNLIQDGDFSRWGALNAVTKIANTHDSYDRATELEEIGNKIIQLAPSQWKEIAAAA